MMKRTAFALLMGSVFLTPGARGSDLWLSGLDTVTRAAHQDGGSSDFLDLFQPGSPWGLAASKVKVFKVSTQFLMQAPPQDLKKVFAGLRTRNIALSVELGLLSGDGRCGVGMEGYSAVRTGEVLADRVHGLGGELDYIAMDEPLWFGKYANKPTSCHSSVEDIAGEIANKIAPMVKLFPDLKVGDIEPVGVPNQIPWASEIRRWLKAYRMATGRNLDFLHADIQWRGAWQSQLKEVMTEATADGITFGVIINSDQPDNSDTAWTAHAGERADAVRKLLGNLPQHVIFQSWSTYPRRFLPEGEKGTMTNMVANFGR